jgi:hypothetical protein
MLGSIYSRKFGMCTSDAGFPRNREQVTCPCDTDLVWRVG